MCGASGFIMPKSPDIESAISDNEATEETSDEASPKKRRRLKSETRRELINRLENPQISLHEAATLLNLCRATIRRYADEGTLPSVRTAGGQRRFYYQDIKEFVRRKPKKKRKQ